MPAVQLRTHAQGETIPSKLYMTTQQLEKKLRCLFLLSVSHLKMLFNALDSLNMVCNITKLGGGQISPHNHYLVKKQQAKLPLAPQILARNSMPWTSLKKA